MREHPEPAPAQIAKAALRRLAAAKLEPTPENYAQAWADELGAAAPSAGLPPRARPLIDKLAGRAVEDPTQRAELIQLSLRGDWDAALRLLDRYAESQGSQSQALAQLIERLTRGLERGGKQWSLARKKDSLQRVLDSSRSDMQRLQHRLRQLVASWDGEGEPGAPLDEAAAPDVLPAPDAPAATASSPAPGPRPGGDHWPAVVLSLTSGLRAALPEDAARAVELADELARLADRLGIEGASAGLAAEVAEVCERARRLLAHRQQLLVQVHRLSLDLAGSLADLAEDDSWVQGQIASLQGHLGEAPSARSIQAAAVLLADTRLRQRGLRGDRDRARQTLKALIQQMLGELGELDQQTGQFSDGMLRYADTIERAESLESLAGVVREMVAESRAVNGLVRVTRDRLQGQHSRAAELEAQVRDLEAELRRLSDEVATDALTQIANRRGLLQHFEIERARLEREGSTMAVGLLDIDNFKRLNDSLGHAAGDLALVALAQRVRQTLRPVDVVARFGGEEFVVLLPGTPVEEAQQVLTRLQRLLTASLFMHDGNEVFVTFSAGATAYRPGERLEDALERADEALYEAKRTGKNRTCVA